MASRKNNAELRQNALSALAEGRAEISVETHRLRVELSPSRVMHRVVDHHVGLTVVIAFAAGFIPALLMFRRPHPRHVEQRPVISAARPEPKSTISARLFGLLASAATPGLMKLVMPLIVTPLLNSLNKRQPDAPVRVNPAA